MFGFGYPIASAHPIGWPPGDDEPAPESTPRRVVPTAARRVVRPGPRRVEPDRAEPRGG